MLLTVMNKKSQNWRMGMQKMAAKTGVVRAIKEDDDGLGWMLGIPISG